MSITVSRPSLSFFFFNDTATTEIYTLCLHDALPILRDSELDVGERGNAVRITRDDDRDASLARRPDRKSTRLNSSHQIISYAVFCLKKKKKTILQKNPSNTKTHINTTSSQSTTSCTP